MTVEVLGLDLGGGSDLSNHDVVDEAVRAACVENGWLITEPRIWNLIQHLALAIPRL